MSDYRSDSMIDDDVAQRLATVCPGHRIMVSVHDGRVTLRGTVTDTAVRRAIKDEVADVDGVCAITDLLSVATVGLPATTAARSPATTPVTPIGEARRRRLHP